jgi:hypothetical protein
VISVSAYAAQESVDARSRAARSLLWGLAVDVSVAVVLALITNVGGLEWTATYWRALGLMVAKTAVQAAVAYAGRRLIPPPAS